jgi:hypothetical protein
MKNQSKTKTAQMLTEIDPNTTLPIAMKTPHYDTTGANSGSTFKNKVIQKSCSEDHDAYEGDSQVISQKPSGSGSKNTNPSESRHLLAKPIRNTTSESTAGSADKLSPSAAMNAALEKGDLKVPFAPVESQTKSVAPEALNSHYSKRCKRRKVWKAFNQCCRTREPANFNFEEIDGSEQRMTQQESKTEGPSDNASDIVETQDRNTVDSIEAAIDDEEQFVSETSAKSEFNSTDQEPPSLFPPTFYGPFPPYLDEMDDEEGATSRHIYEELNHPSSFLLKQLNKRQEPLNLDSPVHKLRVAKLQISSFHSQPKAWIKTVASASSSSAEEQSSATTNQPDIDTGNSEDVGSGEKRSESTATTVETLDDVASEKLTVESPWITIKSKKKKKSKEQELRGESNEQRDRMWTEASKVTLSPELEQWYKQHVSQFDVVDSSEVETASKIKDRKEKIRLLLSKSIQNGNAELEELYQRIDEGNVDYNDINRQLRQLNEKQLQAQDQVRFWIAELRALQGKSPDLARVWPDLPTLPELFVPTFGIQSKVLPARGAECGPPESSRLEHGMKLVVPVDAKRREASLTLDSTREQHGGQSTTTPDGSTDLRERLVPEHHSKAADTSLALAKSDTPKKDGGDTCVSVENTTKNGETSLPSTVKCFICDKWGHGKWDCPRKDEDRCSTCGKVGHKCWNCRSVRNDFSFNGRCKWCGKTVGHKEWECRLKTRPVDSTLWSALEAPLMESQREAKSANQHAIGTNAAGSNPFRGNGNGKSASNDHTKAKALPTEAIEVLTSTTDEVTTNTLVGTEDRVVDTPQESFETCQSVEMIETIAKTSTDAVLPTFAGKIM